MNTFMVNNGARNTIVLFTANADYKFIWDSFLFQFPVAAHQLAPSFMAHPHPGAVQPGHPLTTTHATHPSLNPLQPQPQFLPHHHPQLHVSMHTFVFTFITFIW